MIRNRNEVEAFYDNFIIYNSQIILIITYLRF